MELEQVWNQLQYVRDGANLSSRDRHRPGSAGLGDCASRRS